MKMKTMSCQNLWDKITKTKQTKTGKKKKNNSADSAYIRNHRAVGVARMVVPV
jgi:hypothetical protein